MHHHACSQKKEVGAYYDGLLIQHALSVVYFFFWDTQAQQHMMGPYIHGLFFIFWFYFCCLFSLPRGCKWERIFLLWIYFYPVRFLTFLFFFFQRFIFLFPILILFYFFLPTFFLQSLGVYYLFLFIFLSFLILNLMWILICLHSKLIS